jgi:hypothetical protein
MRRDMHRIGEVAIAIGLPRLSQQTAGSMFLFLALAVPALAFNTLNASGAPNGAPAPPPILEGAHYCHIKSGESWEADSRTGPYADLVVDFVDQERKFNFWRGSSYLPYWQTEQGKWYVQEIVPRHGDGSGLLPDKVCQYSHVRLIEASPARVIVHWRYVPDFSDPQLDGWVDEYFTIYPDGVCVRTIRKKAARLDDWLDPSRVVVQYLKAGAGWHQKPACRMAGPAGPGS